MPYSYRSLREMVLKSVWLSRTSNYIRYSRRRLRSP